MCSLPSVTSAQRIWRSPNLIQRILGPLTMGVKRSVRETDHLPPHSAEVKNKWRYTSTTFTKLNGVYRDNFVTMPYFALQKFGT